MKWGVGLRMAVAAITLALGGCGVDADVVELCRYNSGCECSGNDCCLKEGIRCYEGQCCSGLTCSSDGRCVPAS